MDLNTDTGDAAQCMVHLCRLPEAKETSEMISVAAIVERASSGIARRKCSAKDVVNDLIYESRVLGMSSPTFKPREDTQVLKVEPEDYTTLVDIDGETYEIKVSNKEIFDKFDRMATVYKDPEGAVDWLKDQPTARMKKVSAAQVRTALSASDDEDVLTGLRGKG